MGANDQPKYEIIAADLRRAIERGTYPVGSKLPSKADLKARYGVAQNTVDHAIYILRDLGLVESKQGVATFVIAATANEPSSEYEAVMARVDDLAEEVRQLRVRVEAGERDRAASG